MRRSLATAGAVALVGTALAQSDSVSMKDADTGFTWSSFTIDEGLTFRVAVPSPAPANASFDAVFQLIAPKAIGWAGLAWGGGMTYNPLAIMWPNGNDVVLTSRMAYGYYTPPPYPDATYTLLKKASHVNATHMQVTAKCTGCTRWGDNDIGITQLDPTNQNFMAFAYSNTPVDEPANPDSTFGIHDLIGHWVEDLSQGANPDFAALVAKNLGDGSGTTTPAPSSSAAPSPAPSSGSSAPTTSTTGATKPTGEACTAKKTKKRKIQRQF